MLEELVSWTSLPNLHPLAVHFPVALLPTALLFDFLGLFYRRLNWSNPAATALYALTAAAAAIAYWAGRQAADSFTDLAPQVQPHLSRHSDLALYAVWALAALAVLRLAIALWEQAKPRATARTVLLAAAVGVLGLLLKTADLGGGLVYRHQVGVATGELALQAPGAPETPEETAPQPPTETATSPGPAESRLVKSEDGSLLWAPLASDARALREILRPAPGFSTGTVSWREETGDHEGLRLEVNGRSLLVLPGTFGDVHLEAELALEGFEGTVALAHHVESTDDAEFLSLSTEPARVALLSSTAGVETKLDETPVELPSGTFRLAVSAAGRHQKASLNGRTVAHGHEPPRQEGACGLFVDGTGAIRIVWMRVIPLVGE
jgi:uncharacterized membrane protein